MAHKINYSLGTKQVRDRFGTPIGSGEADFNKELRRVHDDTTGNLKRAEPETSEERRERALNNALRRLAGHD